MRSAQFPFLRRAAAINDADGGFAHRLDFGNCKFVQVVVQHRSQSPPPRQQPPPPLQQADPTTTAIATTAQPPPHSTEPRNADMRQEQRQRHHIRYTSGVQTEAPCSAQRRHQRAHQRGTKEREREAGDMSERSLRHLHTTAHSLGGAAFCAACVRSWERACADWAKRFPHPAKVHTNGFSPVCVRS